jgi:hypothetical protein
MSFPVPDRLGKIAASFLLGWLALTGSAAPARPAGGESLGQPLLSDAALAGALNLDQPGLEKVKAAAAAGDFAQARQAYLNYRRSISTVRWRVMPSDKPKTAVSTDDPAGDEVVNHVIRNMYGFSPKVGDMGRDFDWTYNPVPRGSPNFSSEWTFCVISRTQFWNVLADAYWRTGDEKYAREWVAELEDFAKKNPIERATGFSPLGGPDTLWRTLDAGIRMHDSWPYAYAHFVNSPAFTAEANWLFLNEIHTHGTRLAAGLADPKRSGNWVTTECFGLYTLAVLFPELKESGSWRSLAMERMTKEILRVVPPDGFEVELTPNYHTVALEGFTGVFQLARLNNLPVPGVFRERMLSMYRALVLMMQQNGNVVATNDSMEVNAVPLAREGLRLGDDPLLEWAATGGKSGTAPPLSAMLPYAGFYVLRGGWDPRDFFLFFRGGPSGAGHQHEDMNEIVLRDYGQTFLADPGNYLYDHSEWRRYVINTPSHNTIIVDGKWQHRGPSGLPVTEPVHNPWVTTPLFDFVSAQYDGGYQENVYDGSREFDPEKWIGAPDKSVSHTRRVLYLKPAYALILDTVDGTGEHVFDAHFHLNVNPARLDPQTLAAYAGGNGSPLLALFPLDRDNLEADIVRGQKSPMLGWAAGSHQPMPTLRYRKKQAAPAVFSTFLYPTAGPVPTLSSQLLSAGAGIWGRRLETGLEEIEIALAEGGAARSLAFSSELAGPVTARAAGLVLRRPARGNALFVGAWSLQAYDDGALELTLAAPGTLVAERDGERLLLFNPSPASLAVTLEKPYARTLNLPPGAWTEINPRNENPAAPPVLPF